MSYTKEEQEIDDIVVLAKTLSRLKENNSGPITLYINSTITNINIDNSYRPTIVNNSHDDNRRELNMGIGDSFISNLISGVKGILR